MKIFAALMAGLFLIATSAYAEAIKHGDLMLDDITIHATIPGAKVSAGYLEITNHGGQDDRLISISLEGANRAEIHEMNVDNGIMRMRPVDGGLMIPAGGTAVLEPGGLHLMFMQLTDQPMDGETRQLTLMFERSGPITLPAPVTKIGAGHWQHGSHGHDEHGHSHDDHEHGYGHDDQGCGHGHDDHEHRYGHDDQGRGHGHDDHEHGYGHDDQGRGHGHDDHEHGYGHDDQGRGHGHDDHGHGYGHDGHGHGYGHEIICRMMEKISNLF